MDSDITLAVVLCVVGGTLVATLIHAYYDLYKANKNLLARYDKMFEIVEFLERNGDNYRAGIKHLSDCIETIKQSQINAWKAIEKLQEREDK